MEMLEINPIMDVRWGPTARIRWEIEINETTTQLDIELCVNVDHRLRDPNIQRIAPPQGPN